MVYEGCRTQPELCTILPAWKHNTEIILALTQKQVLLLSSQFSYTPHKHGYTLTFLPWRKIKKGVIMIKSDHQIMINTCYWGYIDISWKRYIAIFQLVIWCIDSKKRNPFTVIEVYHFLIRRTADLASWGSDEITHLPHAWFHFQADNSPVPISEYSVQSRLHCQITEMLPYQRYWFCSVVVEHKFYPSHQFWS